MKCQKIDVHCAVDKCIIQMASFVSNMNNDDEYGLSTKKRIWQLEFCNGVSVERGTV